MVEEEQPITPRALRLIADVLASANKDGAGVVMLREVVEQGDMEKDLCRWADQLEQPVQSNVMKEAVRLNHVWLCERTGRLADIATKDGDSQECPVHGGTDCLAQYNHQEAT